MNKKIAIIGAGLAGVEAAWQAIRAGIEVDLYEMKPKSYSPAHKTAYFAELVCSNSFRAKSITNAVGLLKEEMRMLDSIVMRSADAHAVPAGGALAVDREAYAREITETLLQNPLIHVHYGRVEEFPQADVVIVATGPLTDGAWSDAIQDFFGQGYFHFFDAAAPIVYADSLDMNIVFRASRYDQGDAAYLNCPMSEAEYYHFRNQLVTAEIAGKKDFEKGEIFEGCMPIEVMGSRGVDAMRFGPMKPVGLPDPRTGKEAYAVVQLRQDNAAGTLYNMVGFQTHLRWGEQERVFRLIPGMEHAEFARFGVMHRNSFINSPQLMLPTLQTRKVPNVFFAGQITGVEGYVESAAAGILAGLNAVRYLRGKTLWTPPMTTALGGLVHYISKYNGKNFQPMNINFGIIEPLAERAPKKMKNSILAERALKKMSEEIVNLRK